MNIMPFPSIVKYFDLFIRFSSHLHFRGCLRNPDVGSWQRKDKKALTELGCQKMLTRQPYESHRLILPGRPERCSMGTAFGSATARFHRWDDRAK